MNYHQYYPVDIVNGPGTRCTLFVSGCVHECPGCYNKSTWRLNSGMPFTPRWPTVSLPTSTTRASNARISFRRRSPASAERAGDPRAGAPHPRRMPRQRYLGLDRL
jgi:anaerobic ribonucleoside-triphosphate reductase activating protein